MRIPLTLSRRSRRYLMSGMTRSMPSICSSGNMSPASTTRMSLPCSIAIMFFPISPTPPSGMTRTALAKERHLLRRLLRLRFRLGHRRDRRCGLEEGRQRLEVLLEIGAERGLVQRRCGVEHGEDGDAVLLSSASVDARDGFAGEELVHRVPAESDHDLWLEERQVAFEPDVTGRDLLRERVAVLGRPVPHDVRDEDLAAVEADPAEELIEKLARGAHERATLDVLVVSGRLAEEEDPRLGAPLAGHGLASAPVERAGRAAADLIGQRGERVVHGVDYRVAGAFRAR